MRWLRRAASHTALQESPFPSLAGRTHRRWDRKRRQELRSQTRSPSPELTPLPPKEEPERSQPSEKTSETSYSRVAAAAISLRELPSVGTEMLLPRLLGQGWRWSAEKNQKRREERSQDWRPGLRKAHGYEHLTA